MTGTDHGSIPTPDLRILPVSVLHAHEEHDSQRSQPLVDRLREETMMINPPLVAPMDGDQYVILDGANRVYSFTELEYPHILVQVASYASGLVELSNWQHVVAGWNAPAFLERLRAIPGLTLVRDSGLPPNAIARIILRDGEWMACAETHASLHQRNAILRQVVAVYQQNARLHRTASDDPDELWPMFPDAIALVIFPPYYPEDIMAAAREKAFLPPGISRHIVHGRAIRVNYPLAVLRDPFTPLERKNADLLIWMQSKLANRQVRYYAEATYQFDE